MPPNLYAPFEARSSTSPTRTNFPGQDSFEEYAIYYAPGDLVSMISSREARNGGPACSYTSNVCEGPSDRATHKEECLWPNAVPQKNEGVIEHKSLG